MQDRTSLFACFDDEKNYKDNSLISRSLPWVVRVYFQSENSINGVLCSGKLLCVLPTSFPDRFFIKGDFLENLLRLKYVKC